MPVKSVDARTAQNRSQLRAPRIGPELALSRYVIFSSPFSHPVSGRQVRVLFSSLSNERLLAADELCTALQCFELEALPPAFVSALHDARMLVPAESNELDTLISENERIDATKEEYLLTIMPTANCQLACTYCGQTHSKEGLAESLEEHTIALAAKQIASASYTHVNVTWFGGEPLIGLPVIRSMTPKLRAIAEQHGARYQASVISNGLSLTPDIAAELTEQLGVVRIQVTIDGLKHTHDMRRFRKGGSGSFERIVGNLRKVATLGIATKRIHIRYNVDEYNKHDIIPLIDYLVDLEIGPLIDRFYITGVIDWDNGADHAALRPEEFGTLQIRTFEKLIEHGLPIDELPARTTGMCKVYYQEDSPLVSSDGSLHNCYEYPLVQHKSRDKLARVGHVKDAKTIIPIRSPTDVMLSMRDDGHACLRCEMLPVCGGVCEPHWQKKIRRCPGFKFNLPDWLKLDYLRSTGQTMKRSVQ